MRHEERGSLLNLKGGYDKMNWNPYRLWIRNNTLGGGKSFGVLQVTQHSMTVFSTSHHNDVPRTHISVYPIGYEHDCKRYVQDE